MRFEITPSKSQSHFKCDWVQLCLSMHKKTIDLRKFTKERIERQRAYVVENPGIDEKILAQQGIDAGIYAKRTGLTLVRISIARIRRHLELVAAGKITQGPDRTEIFLAKIAKVEPPAAQDPHQGKIKRRAAVRAVSAYLKECGWNKVKAASGGELPFWKDSKTSSSHRIDFAFFVAMTRESEISRISKQATSKRRVPALPWPNPS